MKGRKPTTSRISKFYKRLSSEGEKRTIAWLQLAVLFLVVSHQCFWLVANWFHRNYGPLEALLTYLAGCKILQDLLFVRRESKPKKKRKRRRSKHHPKKR
jgi:hypothetical protein